MGVNETVLKYLSDQNRPYSANDIMQNLHKEFGKTAIQKALDILVANVTEQNHPPHEGTFCYDLIQPALSGENATLLNKGKVLEKKYGKQKVYAVMKEGKFNKEEFQARQEKLKIKQMELEEQIGKDEATLKMFEAKLRELKSSVTTPQALKDKNELMSTYENLDKKHKLLTQNVKLITEEEKAKILKDKSRFDLEWRKRKRMAKDILDAIAENYPKDKKTLFEEIGIETDEDVGVLLPPSH